VTLHFETSDPAGRDVVVIHGSAVVERNVSPMSQPDFVTKYAALMEQLGYTAERMNTFSTRIRITPEQVDIGMSGATYDSDHR
jgi:hypothetical protein